MIDVIWLSVIQERVLEDARDQRRALAVAVRALVSERVLPVLARVPAARRVRVRVRVRGPRDDVGVDARARVHREDVPSLREARGVQRERDRVRGCPASRARGANDREHRRGRRHGVASRRARLRLWLLGRFEGDCDSASKNR